MNTNIRRSLDTVLAAAPKALAIATLGCTLAVGAVHAGHATKSVTVPVAGLDVAKPAGASALFLRLRAAARAVCEHPTSGDLAAKAATRECVDETIHRAVMALDHPAFSAWYAAKSGRPVPGAQLASN